ncbi:MAG: type II toxin-antitoxin system VapC family toxin [Acidimicrobiales bacterium]
MILVDINLLLYAYITGYQEHDRARLWWEQAVNSGTPVGLAPAAVFGFLRLSTNRRVIESPLAVEQAVQLVREWLDQPSVSFLTPGPRYLEIAFGLLESVGTAGNLTSDVQLAAHAIEHGGELHSNDADFGRFADLRWVNPLGPTP